jgi:molybdopterin converting factor small subunit
VEVRIRLGTDLARLAPSPLLSVDLADGATIDDLYERLAGGNPQLAPALRSALPVVRGAHADRHQPLTHGDEVALLMPVSGG